MLSKIQIVFLYILIYKRNRYIRLYIEKFCFINVVVVFSPGRVGVLSVAARVVLGLFPELLSNTLELFNPGVIAHLKLCRSLSASTKPPVYK